MLQANIDRLQRVHVLARVVAQAPSTISSADIRRDLHWLSINRRISYKLSPLTWKALYTAEPSYLSELMSTHVPARTRTFLQHVSSSNTNGCYKSLLLTLFVSAPSTWNSFPTGNRLFWPCRRRRCRRRATAALLEGKEHSYIYAYKQIYIAPKSWKRFRGAGTGCLDSKNRLEEVWL